MAILSHVTLLTLGTSHPSTKKVDALFMLVELPQEPGPLRLRLPSLELFPAASSLDTALECAYRNCWRRCDPLTGNDVKIVDNTEALTTCERHRVFLFRRCLKGHDFSRCQGFMALPLERLERAAAAKWLAPATQEILTGLAQLKGQSIPDLLTALSRDLR